MTSRELFDVLWSVNMDLIKVKDPEIRREVREYVDYKMGGVVLYIEGYQRIWHPAKWFVKPFSLECLRMVASIYFWTNREHIPDTHRHLLEIWKIIKRDKKGL